MAESETRTQAIPRAEPADASRAPWLTGVSPALFARHNGSRYRTPIDLQATPDSELRFLVVGGCLAEPFPQVAKMMNKGFKGDFILLNNFDSFTEMPPAPAAE
jgi:hypothetical protein